MEYGVYDIWGSYYNIPRATFYLLQGDFQGLGIRDSEWGLGFWSSILPEICGVICRQHTMIVVFWNQAKILARA